MADSILAHEPIKSALILHHPPFFVLFNGLPRANFRPFWSISAQIMAIRATRTRRVGLAGSKNWLASLATLGRSELAWPASAGLSPSRLVITYLGTSLTWLWSWACFCHHLSQTQLYALKPSQLSVLSELTDSYIPTNSCIGLLWADQNSRLLLFMYINQERNLYQLASQ